MTTSQSYRAALEAAAKVADGCHWVLPMYDNKEMNIASDDAAESVSEQIAAAIRALPVMQDAGDMVIKKRGMYYRPNRQGYTSNISEAGRFTLEEAERETHPNGSDGPRDGMDYEKAPSHAQDMVMVPREPTPEMLEAASGHYLLASIYRAMIRAAGGKP